MSIITQETGQFTGYTLSELRALVLRGLRASNTARYSPTQGTADYDWIDDALNRGIEKFVLETKCLRTYAIIELKSNYRTYRLPEDFIDLMAVYYYDSALSDGYREITIKSIEEINDSIPDWRTGTGDPELFYLDRMFGNTWTFGLYPTPDTDGDTITFDSEFGVVVEWVCPLYTLTQEVGTIIRMTDTDEFFLSADLGTVADIKDLDGNLWLEYYRLPKLLNMSTQYVEIPKEFQKAPIYFAIQDLLSENPEDSVEYKRAMQYEQRFYSEIKRFLDTRKKALAGHNLRATANAWGWYKGMDWYNVV